MSAVCLWLLFLATRGGGIPDLCMVDFATRFEKSICATGFNVRTDPYSLIDPVSLSPLQQTSWEQAYLHQFAVPSWQGVAWVPDEDIRDVADANVVETFSWLSFGLFALVTLGTVVVLSLFPRSPIRLGIQVGLLTWYALEVVRWSIVLLWFSMRFTYDDIVIDAPTLLVAAAVSVPWLLCFLWVRHFMRPALGAKMTSIR